MNKSTIFKHLFKRIALILLAINVIFSLILLPIYQDKLVKMIASQGETFANSTIAACGEALYTKDFSFIISYINKVLKNTPEVNFVNFSSHDGNTIKLTSDGWVFEQQEGRNVLQLERSQEAFSIDHLENIDGSDSSSGFVFSKPIIISGYDWGDFTIGLSDEEYQALLTSYFKNVLLFSLTLVVITLLLLHGSSLSLSQQLTKLRQTASKLAEGDLLARAPTNAIGEISLLANTLNGMAISLDENTRHLRRLARLVQDTNDAIAIFDDNSKIIYVNSALTNFFSEDADHFNGMSLTKFFIHLKIGRNKQKELQNELSGIDFHDCTNDLTFKVSTDKTYHLTMRIEKFDLHEVESGGFFIILSDITRRKQLEQELETLAYIDKLTQLPNRRYFMDRMNEAVEEAEMFNTAFTLIFLDVDNFKIINDSLGHEVGDQVLEDIGWRMQESLRTDDTICRLGGDEFTAIIRGANDYDAISRVCETILNKFSMPVYINDHELRASASIGIVTFPNDGVSTKELIKNADTAMYAAKKSGKNCYRFFSEEMHDNMREYLDIESALRKSINDTGLYLVFQPFVDEKTNSIKHCEALLRWKHPERGMIPPGRFIPIAEQSGLIRSIGDWVFDQVCRQLQEWGSGITVSVNVSGTELVNVNYAERLREKLIEYDISAHQIQLEFTEHVLVSEEGNNLPLLNQLKRMGFQLAVDDFGTGFSSLSYISELPIDVIKLDKSFINRLPEDKRTVAVVKSIISLAHSLDIATVGEGVEEKEQMEWLRSNGCHLIQGFFYHKPMPATALYNLINRGVTQAVVTDIKAKKESDG
ncbi:MAG: EAL domain-containing protein [Candidatus Thiodiazotropha taylori]|nr:EAL domain-containing protein [Candidatus Thiodiazotropha taylori]MCG8105618.1 EAL domain-containing protein [Candidatus Thiodiazotropha taylori]MCG8111146.1 EAL domain-containing protein [Candidatus Thiodiazotropha taylori]MCW4277955.1 EAL domain-containing protein [Candidatus Thiodiazotropha taylori]MCW4283498.1 EAL domain-containing protein [Candidatus Thiodiazotropha taylori]